MSTRSFAASYLGASGVVVVEYRNRNFRVSVLISHSPESFASNFEQVADLLLRAQTNLASYP